MKKILYNILDFIIPYTPLFSIRLWKYLCIKKKKLEIYNKN